MNHKKSFTCDINQIDNLHVKKIYALKNFNSNKKSILDNLIKKNQKYKDIYNLIKRKNNINNNNSKKVNRVFSEDKINSNDNVIYSYDTKFENQTKEEKIKTIYDEIQLLKNNNNINNNYIEPNQISKKVIFDSLNIELPKTLRTNKSNVNIIENNKNENNNLLNLKKVNMSQKNIFNYRNNSVKSIYQNFMPKIEKKYNEKEIKKWIEQEKNSNRNNEKYYNENNLDIFNMNSQSRNSNLPYFNSLYKSKKNGNSFIYSNNYFENELSVFESNLNKINNSGFHKLGNKTRNIKDKNNLKDKFLTQKY